MRLKITVDYQKPLLDLVFRASQIHRENFDSQKVQLAHLVSVKTGGCSEDCAYCPQAARYQTGLKRHGLLSKDEVVALAKKAKDQGCTRVCMGAAWREVKDGKAFDQVIQTIQAVNKVGVEVCATLGLLNEQQARRLKDAGLLAYNHNIDTSKEHYSNIIKTRDFADRLETIKHVQNTGLSLCCGGILGLGENASDHISWLWTLTQMNPQPESVPINTLVAVQGTPLEKQEEIDFFTLLRMIALTRIYIPKAFIRLSAGRIARSQSEQAFCFLAGANSIFTGDKLLTTPNQAFDEDQELLAKLGLKAYQPYELEQQRKGAERA